MQFIVIGQTMKSFPWCNIRRGLSVICDVLCNCSKFKFAVVAGLQNKTYWKMFGKENKIRAKDGFRGKGVKCTAEALIP